MVADLEHIRLEIRACVQKTLLLRELHIPCKQEGLPRHGKAQHQRIIIVILGVIDERPDHLKGQPVSEFDRIPGFERCYGDARLFSALIDLILPVLLIHRDLRTVNPIDRILPCEHLKASDVVSVRMRKENTVEPLDVHTLQRRQKSPDRNVFSGIDQIVCRTDLYQRCVCAANIYKKDSANSVVRFMRRFCRCASGRFLRSLRLQHGLRHMLRIFLASIATKRPTQKHQTEQQDQQDHAVRFPFQRQSLPFLSVQAVSERNADIASNTTPVLAAGLRHKQILCSSYPVLRPFDKGSCRLVTGSSNSLRP
ncbi:unknown [Clostridium sp. CAG:1024]|nr:unknown [Clostridium sp. CAG:1024]